MKDGYLQEFSRRLESMIPALIRTGRNLEVRRLSRYSLTLPQFFALAVLESNGSCMMKELGEELGLSLGTVTGIIDRLIREGFVERYSDERDRRVVRVRLSSKGKEVMEKIHEERRRALEERMREFSEEELSQLLETVVRIGTLFSRESVER